MNFLTKKYCYGKCGTIICIMKDLGIPWDSRCSVIKNLINIDQFIQDDIEYSGKQNGTYMGRNFVLSINYVESNIIANFLKAGFSITLANIEVNEYRRK